MTIQKFGTSRNNVGGSGSPQQWSKWTPYVCNFCLAYWGKRHLSHRHIEGIFCSLDIFFVLYLNAVDEHHLVAQQLMADPLDGAPEPLPVDSNVLHRYWKCRNRKLYTKQQQRGLQYVGKQNCLNVLQTEEPCLCLKITNSIELKNLLVIFKWLHMYMTIWLNGYST